MNLISMFHRKKVAKRKDHPEKQAESADGVIMKNSTKTFITLNASVFGFPAKSASANLSCAVFQESKTQ